MRRLAFAAAGALVGAAAGYAVAAAWDESYRAAATLQVLPSAAATLGDEERPLVETDAQSYAALLTRRSFLDQIRPQVGGGRFSTGELLERVDAEHPPGTALVELSTTAASEPAARSLASDVAGALLGYVQQAARQRSAAVEDDLRRRIAELATRIAEAGTSPARLEALREERAELNAALATQAGQAVAEGTRLALAGAPTVDPDPVGPSGAGWAALGAAGGLVLGALASLVPLARPRREPAALPAPVAGREPMLAEPRPGAVVTGAVAVRSEPEGSPVEWSRDGAAWRAVPNGQWPTAGLADGRYLLRTAGSGAAVPVEVDNTPPSVAVSVPEETVGPVRLRAEAADAGSGVASVEFMLSDGGADWTTIADGPEALWDPAGLEPGVYWICAVARDHAGLPAASDPKPLRVRS